MVNILVVDDHESIRDLVVIHLKRAGYHPLSAENGVAALAVLERHTVSLVIADIMMPGMDGYELVRRLREADHTMPVLMLTAKAELSSKKQGFELGADDYLTKPVDMDELLLRVGALLRRAQIHRDRQITAGDTVLVYDQMTLTVNGAPVELTKKEFYLLYKLLSYPKKIFTRQQLMDDIWGFDALTDERTVDVHIKRLREKLAECRDFELVTVRGLGYKAEKRV